MMVLLWNKNGLAFDDEDLVFVWGASTLIYTQNPTSDNANHVDLNIRMWTLCVCSVRDASALQPHSELSGEDSSITGVLLTLTFLSMPTVSSLSADWGIWEALFICTLLTPPNRGNGAGCVQAINATTMPKVVICHTPVRHNHYMECNAPKFPSLGLMLWFCLSADWPWCSRTHISTGTHKTDAVHAQMQTCTDLKMHTMKSSFLECLLHVFCILDVYHPLVFLCKALTTQMAHDCAACLALLDTADFAVTVLYV